MLYREHPDTFLRCAIFIWFSFLKRSARLVFGEATFH